MVTFVSFAKSLTPVATYVVVNDCVASIWRGTYKGSVGITEL